MPTLRHCRRIGIGIGTGLPRPRQQVVAALLGNLVEDGLHPVEAALLSNILTEYFGSRWSICSPEYSPSACDTLANTGLDLIITQH